MIQGYIPELFITLNSSVYLVSMVTNKYETFQLVSMLQSQLSNQNNQERYLSFKCAIKIAAELPACIIILINQLGDIIYNFINRIIKALLTFVQLDIPKINSHKNDIMYAQCRIFQCFCFLLNQMNRNRLTNSNTRIKHELLSEINRSIIPTLSLILQNSSNSVPHIRRNALEVVNSIISNDILPISNNSCFLDFDLLIGEMNPTHQNCQYITLKIINERLLSYIRNGQNFNSQSLLNIIYNIIKIIFSDNTSLHSYRLALLSYKSVIESITRNVLTGIDNSDKIQLIRSLLRIMCYSMTKLSRIINIVELKIINYSRNIQINDDQHTSILHGSIDSEDIIKSLHLVKQILKYSLNIIKMLIYYSVVEDSIATVDFTSFANDDTTFNLANEHNFVILNLDYETLESIGIAFFIALSETIHYSKVN